jgi:hypothetical protein
MSILATRTPVEMLRGLASGLCRDASIEVMESDTGTWAYNPDNNVILVGKDDLQNKGVLPCAAILAHETAHYHISRYNMYKLPFKSLTIIRELMNGLEDPRVNEWIQHRYPGTKAWFQALVAAESFLRKPFEGPEYMGFIMRNCAEALMGWNTSELPAIRSPRLASAILATASARREFSLIQPPFECASGEPNVGLSASFVAEVGPMLAAAGPKALPALEQEVHLAQARAVTMAMREIVPVFSQLLEADIGRLARGFHEDRRLLQLAEDAVGGKRGATPCRMVTSLILRLIQDPDPNFAIPSHFRDLALKLLEVSAACTSNAPICDSSPSCRTRLATNPTPSKPPRPMRAARKPPQNNQPASYEKTRARLEPQICQLVKTIEDVLVPKRRLRDERGYENGYRLDMREVPHFDADPRRYNRLWCRRNIPSRRELAVTLLVDLSGSMERGGKIQAAFAGTVLLVEMLHRLNVPFAVTGFQNRLIPFFELGDGFSRALASELEWLPAEASGNRPGGNNEPGINDDGPCVLAAASALSEFPATHRLLISVSDGEPAGRGDSEKKLLDAVMEVSKTPTMGIVGLGLGQGTDHVAKYYPRHMANVPEDQLADRIGGLLVEALKAL